MTFWDEVEKASRQLIKWEHWDYPVIIDGVVMPHCLAEGWLMSRTKKGSKGPGYEYWSKRPGNKCGGATGKKAKQITHRAERQKARKIIKSEQ